MARRPRWVGNDRGGRGSAGVWVVSARLQADDGKDDVFERGLFVLVSS